MEEPTYYLHRPGQLLRPCRGFVPRFQDVVVIDGARHIVVRVEIELSDGHPGNSEVEGVVVFVSEALWPR
jgi:hypothetical protein